jgi:FAD/FMN-containing dehydrogenase
MLRRSLLKGMAAIAAVGPAAWPQMPALGAAIRRVRPGDPAWPATAAWQRLNDAVGGGLIEVQSLFGACASLPDGPACRSVRENIRNPFFIGDQPAGTQTSGWLDAWTSAPSVYAVKARDSADVSTAVNFARENNLRLVVKGGGHSYQGTSNAADSLLIWTRAMNQVALHEAFVGSGCEGKIAPQPAVSAGAGAMWTDLYHAVTAQGGRYVQGGGCTTVGVAGLIQSGGFGSFSKGFGTAAASLLEAEIVTADGHIRIANPQTNPDLFWALKGGGGGSWGVVTRLTLRTHALPQNFGGAFGRIKAKTDEAFQRLLARFFSFYAGALLNPHWGEQVSIAPDNSLKLSMVCQGLDAQQVSQTWQPFFDWVKASPEDFIIVNELRAGVTDARHWWDVAGNNSMNPDARDDAPAHHGWWHDDSEQVGVYLHGYDSLWLPAALLRKDDERLLVNALFAASRSKAVGLHFNKGLAGAPDTAIAAAKDTATNPVVIDAFALAIIADGGGPAYPGQPGVAIDRDAAHADARAIARASAELHKLVPDAGSYVSESNYFNRSWRNAFWGTNYSRLKSVKAKYDPAGLFFVHHGVGSEEWSADGFVRQG